MKRSASYQNDCEVSLAVSSANPLIRQCFKRSRANQSPSPDALLPGLWRQVFLWEESLFRKTCRNPVLFLLRRLPHIRRSTSRARRSSVQCAISINCDSSKEKLRDVWGRTNALALTLASVIIIRTRRPQREFLFFEAERTTFQKQIMRTPWRNQWLLTRPQHFIFSRFVNAGNCHPTLNSFCFCLSREETASETACKTRWSAKNPESPYLSRTWNKTKGFWTRSEWFVLQVHTSSM